MSDLEPISGRAKPPDGPGAGRHAVVFVADLMLGSKVRETLKALGWEAVFVLSPDRSEAAMAGPFDLLIADLNDSRLGPMEAIRAAKARSARVLAFGSHVDEGSLAAGRAAGADLVVPRSALANQLPALIQTLFESGSEG